MKGIGVLSLQGAVREHLRMIERAGAHGVIIKKPHELSNIDGLIIPGGESTTISKLMAKYGLIKPIKDLAQGGLPIFGTCAGMILMAKGLIGPAEESLSIMDIEVRRNAFGRQKESFEAEIEVAGLEGGPFNAVFIRAPWIERVGEGVEVLAELDSHIVMAKEKSLLAAAFHPELTEDMRIHELFLKMI
ncbi:MAG: pyridoxal 5'-phosphate synthase glutaminase subunit PdxT [Actinomycetota bacterium]|nr:pyridoxal 5'-phosphate synthase glutaminase subunit PdxT [Actinomycetota bacterium]